ncbi:MAG TPA: FadR family transcriptional regulator [Candidatus Hydrogenedentes bacterium]|nr:FadR family transcriptional regulator [Candidatus Hydrogenedentota bacterium]
MAEQLRADRSAPRTASRILASTLIRRLLDGGYPAGHRMPTEREMAQQFGVSRHVVREALKHLEALGLVKIHQGSGVYPNDVLLSGGMELFEYILFCDDEHFNGEALRDLLLFCRLFVPNVLRLAAKNRTPEQVSEIKKALVERPLTAGDTKSFTAANLRLLRTISKATHNIIYQLIFNNLGRILAKVRLVIPIEQLAPIIEQHDLEEIVRAIEAQDDELAGLLAQRLAEHSQDTVNTFLTGLRHNQKILSEKPG